LAPPARSRLTRRSRNPGPASPLSINAGTDITVNAAVGRTTAGTPSSAVTLNAGQNINLNNSIVTENAAISVIADNGSLNIAASKGLFAGTGDVAMRTAGDLTTGAAAGGIADGDLDGRRGDGQRRHRWQHR
jgi:hypothetical protein